jgi:hypothetical protein
MVVVREYALDQLESKRLVEVLELQELRTLHATQQTEVLEDNKRVAGGGIERLCRSVSKSHRLKLISEQHAAIFLYDLVDDEHVQLSRCRRRRGRHHSRPRFIQLENAEGGPISQRMPVGPSVKGEKREHRGDRTKARTFASSLP